MQQLPLTISLRDDATFENFLSTGSNSLAVQCLQALQGGGEYNLLYLSGAAGTGRTHLMQAVCHRQQASIYLPMDELSTYQPTEVFAALEHQPLVCLDDVDSLAGRKDWEEALFNFLNRKMVLGGVVLLAADQVPGQRFILPDLVSRLQQALVLRLYAPDDTERASILELRGDRRGMRMPAEVTGFILRHSGRDLHQLMELLDELDRQSLEQKRRITVPFVGEVLAARQNRQLPLGPRSSNPGGLRDDD